MENQFGYKKTEHELSEYIGKWVIIYVPGISTNFAGKIDKIKDGCAIINPFQRGDVKEGKLVRGLMFDEIGSRVPLAGSTIEPVTEQYLLDYCKLLDKRDEEQLKKEEKKE